ncbi:MAG: hypothetical protein AAFV29_22050 [Myxococcota bacterium]
MPRRLTEDQQEIYTAELDNLALGPEDKGRQAFEAALSKAYELNIYNNCTLTAQQNLKALNPNQFPDLQKRRYLGAEGFITSGYRADVPGLPDAPISVEPKPAISSAGTSE